MTEYCKRCIHCKAEYIWQGSGEWNQDNPEKYNDQHYCPDCKKVILEALTKVRPRYKEVMVPTKEVTISMLLDAKKKRVAAQGGVAMHRVFPGLYDPVTGLFQQNGQETYKGKIYQWSFWENEPEANATIYVKMRKDLTDGSMTPWKDL